MLTWSFGWTGFLEPNSPPRISIARFEMTSLTFMLVWVPDPVWKTTRGKWEWREPLMTYTGKKMWRRQEDELRMEEVGRKIEGRSILPLFLLRSSLGSSRAALWLSLRSTAVLARDTSVRSSLPSSHWTSRPPPHLIPHLCSFDCSWAHSPHQRLFRWLQQQSYPNRRSCWRLQLPSLGYQRLRLEVVAFSQKVLRCRSFGGNCMNDEDS